MGHITKLYQEIWGNSGHSKFIPKSKNLTLSFLLPKNKPENADFREKGSKTFSSKVLTDILLQDFPELISGNFGSIYRTLLSDTF